MLRRKRLPADLLPVQRAFEETLRFVERAKEAVVDVMPRARAPGRPLADSLLEFDELLVAAAQAMPAWRAPEVEAEWETCRAALDDARRRGEGVRLEAPELGFDALAFTVQDLIAPLEAFEAAAERFRALRRRP